MLVVEDAPETCEAIWRVAARRIDWRAGLFTAVTAAVLAAMFGVMPTPTAGASTIITGDRDSSLSLEIVPASDPITTQVTASSGLTVAFIQRMPVTKTVRRVTLGDLSVGSGCGATALQLFIREHLTGDVDTSSQIAYSADHRSLPGAPGKVTWDIPSTTLLKGRGYSFRLAMPQGCGTFALTNWAADAPPVNAGPARCAQGPMMDPAGTQVRWRMYHVQGVNDAQTPCVTVPPPVPPYFDPTMPTGWLVTSGSYVFHRDALGSRTQREHGMRGRTCGGRRSRRSMAREPGAARLLRLRVHVVAVPVRRPRCFPRAGVALRRAMAERAKWPAARGIREARTR